MLDYAVHLLQAGYSPIPLDDQKRPMTKWAPWRFVAPTPDELQAMPWRRARGLAVLTGRPQGFVALDADDQPSWRWLRAHLPGVRGTQTRRGGHVYCRHPAGKVALKSLCGEKAILPAPGVRIEVKALASYVVAPYSLHPSGFRYLPLGDWTTPLSTLPVFPPAWLSQAAYCRPAPPAPPRPHRAEGDAETAFASYLRKRGGIPPIGSSSHWAVFRAAAWAKGRTALSEESFISMVLAQQPTFDREWIADRWRGAGGAA
jgi:hypothetical protein